MHTETPQAAEDLRSVLGSILDHNGGRWLRFILAILKNEADAEDVLQDAVHRVLVRNRPLPSKEDIKMYLGRAIGNSALERYNRRKRERLKHVPIQEGILLPPNSRSPYTYLEERELSDKRDQMLQLIQKGLRHLPMKQHEALRLTILESRGLSIRDVGTSNGIPYSTLRHRSKQGLRSLRKFIQREMKNRSQNSEFRIQNVSEETDGSS
jgi:RNA polymerase sigma-70 factor (ECF subfamily)